MSRLHSVRSDGGPRSSGPPLVLLHGAGGTHMTWPAELRRLPGREVYALDLAGHGQSPGPPPGTIGGHVDLLLDWLRSAAVGPAVLVGHSMGAALAMAAAAREPGAVVGLGLIGASLTMAVNPELLRRTGERRTLPAIHARIVELQFSRAAPRSLVDAVASRVDQNSLAALHNDLLACDRFDFTARAEAVAVPTLVVCGEDDRMIPLSDCRALARALPDARFKIILNAGHLAMLERPERVGRLLDEYLNQILAIGRVRERSGP